MTSAHLLFVLPVVLALVPAPRLLGCEPAAARQPKEPAAPTALRPAPVAPAGLVAFVDPQTGTLVEPPPAEAAAMLRDGAFRRALSTSHDGLYEVKRATGGYGLRLQGRFQSTLLAVVGPDGKLRVGHPAALSLPAVSHAPAQEEGKGRP